MKTPHGQNQSDYPGVIYHISVNDWPGYPDLDSGTCFLDIYFSLCAIALYHLLGLKTMTEEAILTSKLATWRLTSSSSRTSVAEFPIASASCTKTYMSTLTNASATLGASTSKVARGSKRKCEEEYKTVPDPTFPTFNELRILTSRDARVKSHLAFITEYLEKRNGNLASDHEEHVKTHVNNLDLLGQISDTLSETPTRHQARTARLNLLPKTHENGISGRPKISGNNCHTEQTSSFINEILKPYVPRIKHYVNDPAGSVSIMNKLETFAESCILVTWDVTSLYINIPNADGLRAIAILTRDKLHIIHAHLWQIWHSSQFDESLDKVENLIETNY